MGYYYKRSSNKTSSRGTSAWSTAGETCRLETAMAEFGVTEKQVQDAKPPISVQCRSMYGNPYYVVIRAEIRDLRDRLDRIAEKKALEEEIEKCGGKEKYLEMKAAKEAQEKAKLKAEAEMKAVKEAQEEAKRKEEETVRKSVKALFELEAFSDKKVLSVEDVWISKTKTKTWGVREKSLDEIASKTVGKYNKYNLRDIIRKTELSKPALGGRLKDETDLAYLNYYLKEELIAILKPDVCPPHLLKESVNKACNEMKGKVNETLSSIASLEKKLKEEKVELGKRKARESEFENFVKTIVPDHTDTNTNIEGQKKVSVTDAESLPKKTKVDLGFLSSAKALDGFSSDEEGNAEGPTVS